MVTTDHFGMRGIDYRASTHGISLIIADSFKNHREVIQGLSRVGRFQDPCRRYLVKGVELVDSARYKDYRVKLLGMVDKLNRTSAASSSVLGKRTAP